MSENKITVVIPTLQKRTDVLEKLICNLNDDDAVGEIIVIDNSTKGLDFKYEKLKVIVPKSNMFVNPSWNFGTKEAKYEIVGLLNDDIIIAKNTCTRVLKELDTHKNIGAIAFDFEDIIPVKDIQEAPEEKEFEICKADFVAGGYGMALFFRKEIYVPIPETMKIWFGDNYIFNKIQESGFDNYWIKGQKVYHLGSLSSEEYKKKPIYKQDKKAWYKLKYKWYHHIFSVEQYVDCKKIRIFGINLKIKTDRKWDDIKKNLNI